MNWAMQGRGNRSAYASIPQEARPSGTMRVQIYLPIADIPVNIFLILAMGAAVGFVSGMFGVGGGFLMTPLLIFVGIAPAVAVASVASHIAASSFSGAITYWRRRAIDPALAAVLLTGGTARHRARRPDLHLSALARPARPDDRAVLRRAAHDRRRRDAVRGPARDPAHAARRACRRGGRTTGSTRCR